MLRISDTRIDGFIAEDVPYVDLTCAVLGIGDEPGEMEYFTREDGVLAGANVVARIMGKLGCDVVEARRDGERATAGEAFFRVRGTAGDLHISVVSPGGGRAFFDKSITVGFCRYAFCFMAATSFSRRFQQ